jgi:hypothetical protein
LFILRLEPVLEKYQKINKRRKQKDIEERGIVVVA